MINPCPKRVLCPVGTGEESSGTNYTSEHIDVPEFRSVYYPSTPYGYYTACQGRCMSLVSQEDANLCALRLATICRNQVLNPGKNSYSNAPQICTLQSTGRMVIVPAGTFIADSQEEANQQALSYANSQQINPELPPGVHNVPPPTTTVPSTGGLVPIVIPVPTTGHHPPEPPAPPTSQCLPCDDTVGVSSFSVGCAVPADADSVAYESPPLKCGEWRFEIVTDDPGSIDDGESAVTMILAVNNPERTPVDWGTLVDCPQIAFVMPCSPGDCSAPRTDLHFGFYPGCCNQTSTTCKYAQCQTMEDGQHFLVRLQIYYASAFPTGNSAKHFTVNGTWLAPVP